MDASGRPPGTERPPGTSGEGERTAFASDFAAAARSESRGRSGRSTAEPDPGARREPGRPRARARGTGVEAPEARDERAGPESTKRSEAEDSADEGAEPDRSDRAGTNEAAPPAGPATPTDTPPASGRRAPLASEVGEEVPPSIELPAPGDPGPAVGAVVAAALGVPLLAIPTTATAPGPAGPEAPSSVRGTSSATGASTGTVAPAEAAPPPAAPAQLDNAMGGHAGSGDTTGEGAPATRIAESGPDGTRPGTPHGFATAMHAESARSHAPEPVQPAPMPAPHPSGMERAERVLQQVRLRISPGLNRATLALEPANLGRIAIGIEVRSGRLRAVLRAEKPETLGVLEAHVPELRAMLEQSGIDAKDIDLGLGAEGGAGPETGARKGSGSNPGGAAHDPFDFEGTDPIGARRLAGALMDEHGVDTYA